MTIAARSLLLALVLLVGCGGPFRPLWHDLVLPSGTPIRVTSLHMVWGIEHDERDVSKDSFALEYVTPDPQADDARRDKEALEVFELIRPASEQFGFRIASVAAFPAVERKGHYRIYNFSRGPEGAWMFERHEAKVFVND